MPGEEVTLDFIAQRLERIQAEQTEIRQTVHDTAADVTVLTGLVLRLARDMVHVKEMLGRMESRISKIELPGE
jgi:hypothetical protein